MNVKTVMVVGAGQMGSGIAQVFISAGYDVYLHDKAESQLEKGIDNIKANLKRQVDKGRMKQTEADEAFGRLVPSSELEDGSKADLVVEAAIENMDIKKDIFQQLDECTPPHAILATNTSSLPITEIAAATLRPKQVIGMHFMNPVPVMKLVEIIRGLATSDDVFQTVQTTALSLQKKPVEVNDFPGFVSNRVLIPMINEAIYAVHEGVASVEDIDQVMTLGMNHPMGPLTLADFIGLDTCLYIMETLHDGLGDDKYRPCPLLRKYVKAGWIGKKAGRGFYQYHEE
ncbi:3-hydroxybutyryl-CoA dehydrogenase [Alteribacillus persepolensis]|uniref:3-hydroxybutyryl-CoA dehydrogenase n=1 Tax=Alteribacillus persepolensis TaxID=568899 RepID=A0A1G8G2H1_9BACI|nr:3-hydroxybutyryl-CoA dehydrogenase [Alteribacillus persepolensis]SDH88500.1 3-hydroxybutyryl-CoA dehydrogenase [Alteribacillus persepolensis]